MVVVVEEDYWEGEVEKGNLSEIGNLAEIGSLAEAVVYSPPAEKVEEARDLRVAKPNPGLWPDHVVGTQPQCISKRSSLLPVDSHVYVWFVNPRTPTSPESMVWIHSG